MKIEQIYTKCLAHAAYYVESEGEAVVIDPLREIDSYFEMAQKNGAKIKYIFETHFHADFVSGHLELAKKSGAQIVYGPTAEADFDFHIAKDGEIFQVGKLTFELLHTPGHTMESSCFLLRDENGKEIALFSGDTLFIGDVGRPDLAQRVFSDLTQDKLAGHMFDSLRNKIMPLSDEIVVYPGHGAGSACGKNMSKETFDTLGNQKKVNYALNPDLSKDEFIKELTTGLTPSPAYFPNNAVMNRKESLGFDDVLKKNLKPLSVEEFETLAAEPDVLVLDTRHQNDFVKGFVPNSYFIGVQGDFAPWVGTVIENINQKIIFISEIGKEEEVIMRLSRIGYDNVLGFLNRGFDEWKNEGKPVETLESIDISEFEKQYTSNPEINILDVRRAGEFDSEHVKSAQNLPVDYIHKNLHEASADKTYFVHCAGGYRSVIFASIAKSKGYDKLINVEGGFGKIKTSDVFPKTEFVCPTTML
ncbi:MBL fold metallo-hydrolase [Moheibacter lacus]|uniref:MBL fold metallo-hydrolase n=1 Tax=Moheibacter lacus TaxID=2745851 RepID=A0A838ZID5_9FLAO|nr:MBL fold metallo-hydrolase [Moheibacter lacus]MBA5629431.1 MBL fold metallo-hydrolase [Moheibacter lacus]